MRRAFDIIATSEDVESNFSIAVQKSSITFGMKLKGGLVYKSRFLRYTDVQAMGDTHRCCTCTHHY